MGIWSGFSGMRLLCCAAFAESAGTAGGRFAVVQDQPSVTSHLNGALAQQGFEMSGMLC